jgi:hypothetical protein
LTLNGVLSIQENNAPTADDGYGKLYVLNDGALNYKRGDSQEFQLSLVDAESPAHDGYVVTANNTGVATWKDPALVLERLIVNEDGTLVLDGDGNPTFTSS